MVSKICDKWQNGHRRIKNTFETENVLSIQCEVHYQIMTDFEHVKG